MKALFLGAVVSTMAFLAASDGCTTENADKQVQQAVNDQQGIYNKNQPIHTYQWSRERAAIQAIYDYRIQKGIDTWTVWSGSTGEPIDMCVSKGFPIPYTTSMTNPEQVTGGYGVPGASTGNVTTGQAEPNGLYPGTTTATWILCVGDDGNVYPQYVEPDVITYVSPIKIEEVNGKRRIVHIGKPNTSSAIDMEPKK